ncbi:hypothetical protein HK101_003296, partial [Irineochytrium annulatum]
MKGAFLPSPTSPVNSKATLAPSADMGTDAQHALHRKLKTLAKRPSFAYGGVLPMEVAQQQMGETVEG